MISCLHLSSGPETYLSGIRITGHLRSGRTVQINNDVESGITRPSTDLFQVLQPALRKVFAVRVDQIFTDPVTHRDANDVEAVRLHLGYVVLRGPRAPVFRPSRVGRSLPEHTHAVKLGLGVAAAHGTPLTSRHPGLEDELRTEVDSADFRCAGESRSLARKVAMSQRTVVA